MENYENSNLNENGAKYNAPAAEQQTEQPAPAPVEPATVPVEPAPAPAEPAPAPVEPAQVNAYETPVISIENGAPAAPQSEPAPQFDPAPQSAPVYNAPAPAAPAPDPGYTPQRFEYTPVQKDTEKRSNTGLKVFCLVLAFIVCITGACSVGYLYGRSGLSTSGKKHSAVQLAATPDNGKEMTEAQVYEQLNKSIVGIRVYNDDGKCTDCSGVVYSDDGYIVSNDHIYAEVPNAKFKIYSYDGKEYDAIYIAGDQVSDLTVLKVSGADLEPATFGDSKQAFCGEHVVAIGRPTNAKGATSVTSGVISLPSRRVKSTSSYSSNFIEADSAINPGSSGGALVNMYGQVIGITSSKLAGLVYDSICYAIPSRTVALVVEDLIKEGKVTSRAKIGITYSEIDSVTAEVKGYSSTGLYISAVSSESDLYGKLTEGDIITRVNGKDITADTVLLDVIDELLPGDTITVTVLSADGATNDYQVKLIANEGASSYNTGVTVIGGEDNGSNESGDIPDSSIFNFPFGN